MFSTRQERRRSAVDEVHMCFWLYEEDHRAFLSVCMQQNPSVVNGIAPLYRHFALLLW